MKLSNIGLALIKSFEGVRLTAYKAVSAEQYYTIGYGHYGPDVKKDMKITQTQADAYLKADVARFEKAVNDYVKVPLNQNQFDALVSFTYNCGAGALQRSTLLELLNQGKYEEAADQFDLWNKSGNTVLAGLVKRRAKEKELFLKDLPKETAVKPTETKVDSEIVSSPSVLEKGDKGNAVKKLQQKLIDKGFKLTKYGADGHYGDETVNAVKVFQKAVKITVDGVYGPVTAKKLDEYKKPSTSNKTNSEAIVPYPGHLIKVGSKGKDVERIQRAVGVTADGIFGNATKKAVQAYQKRHGLEVDGIVGKKTWNKMF